MCGWFRRNHSNTCKFWLECWHCVGALWRVFPVWQKRAIQNFLLHDIVTTHRTCHPWHWNWTQEWENPADATAGWRNNLRPNKRGTSQHIHTQMLIERSSFNDVFGWRWSMRLATQSSMAHIRWLNLRENAFEDLALMRTKQGPSFFREDLRALGARAGAAQIVFCLS